MSTHHVLTVQGDIRILHIHGKLMGGPETDEIRTICDKLAAEGVRKLVLDMSTTSWMNSTGIGACVYCLQTMNQLGGTVVAASITKNINELMIVSKINLLFNSFNTLDEAIAAISA